MKDLDLLQNLEFAIVSVYREEPRLLDYDVLQAVEGLIRVYRAEERGYAPPAIEFTGPAQQVFDSAKEICQWRMGREKLGGAGLEEESRPMRAEEIVAALRKIQGSIQFWTRERGRQGYLAYIEGFMV